MKAKLNAFRWARRRAFGSPAETLASSGWMRGVGGASPYLAFWNGGWGRSLVDAALSSEEILELPSARGCTYFLPRQHAALGLKLGQPAAQVPVRAAMKHLGVTEGELDALRSGVLSVLREGEMDPKALRERLGDLVRNLGEEGKKRGQTTTLSLALGPLQSEGKILRVSASGRLDQERYRYKLWDQVPFAEDPLPELARLYFGWAGPASLEHFLWFSGATKTAARSALANLDLVEREGFLASDADWEAFDAFEVPASSDVVFVGSLDNHFLLRRDAGDALSEEVRDKTPMTRGLQDFAHHPIVDRGEVIGFWQFDAEAGELVWAAFRPVDPEIPRRVEAFIRDELGDFRSFSLDSPKSRREAVAQVRAMR